MDINNAVYEQSRADNISAPFSGMFEQDDGSVYVVGNATSITGDQMSVTQDTSGDVTVSITTKRGTRQQSDVPGASCVTISTPGGNNTINIDPSVTEPVSVYGGSGSNVSGSVENWPDVTLEADLPTVSESGGQTGEFTFSCPNDATGPVTVYFQIRAARRRDRTTTFPGATPVGGGVYR